jgi:hypothetical protein
MAKLSSMTSGKLSRIVIDIPKIHETKKAPVVRGFFRTSDNPEFKICVDTRLLRQISGHRVQE